MKKYYFDDNKEQMIVPVGDYEDINAVIGDNQTNDNILNILRQELKIPENERGELDFASDGVEYTGVPMLEVNSNKFVFKLVPSNQMKMFILSDIVIK